MIASEHIDYHQTNAFSKTILDYLEGKEELKSFYTHQPDIGGIGQAIEARKKRPVERKVLTEALQEQYKDTATTPAVKENIQSLMSDKCFTVCTAHQPNLFTGPLYFLYKILHTIKLAAYLKEVFPDHHFVPVYYMGSEDADLAELNHFYIRGKRYEWKTEQKGAVGRMIIDKDLTLLVDEMEKQLGVEGYGKEVSGLIRTFYLPGKSIQKATLDLVNELFGKFGLVVLIPDSLLLKRQMISIFEDDIFSNSPARIVEATSEKLARLYDAQAYPREINLFYLKDNIRERIERKDDHFCVCHTDIVFSESELKSELKDHPERFSPNVILRGLFQETILPNLAFIGGGGELAYWLQLKDLFEHYDVPFPVLILRNSFMIIENNLLELTGKLGLTAEDLFEPELVLINKQLERAGKKPQLNGEVKELESIYEHLRETAAAVDPSLYKHVEALKTRTLNQLASLEKKMLQAERKKHEATQRQIRRIKEQLFPRNGLQERVENFSTFYAKWGRGLIDILYQHTLPIEQKFTILKEGSSPQ